jgi:hypothetical protein
MSTATENGENGDNDRDATQQLRINAYFAEYAEVGRELAIEQLRGNLLLRPSVAVEDDQDDEEDQEDRDEDQGDEDQDDEDQDEDQDDDDQDNEDQGDQDEDGPPPSPPSAPARARQTQIARGYDAPYMSAVRFDRPAFEARCGTQWSRWTVRGAEAATGSLAAAAGAPFQYTGLPNQRTREPIVRMQCYQVVVPAPAVANAERPAFMTPTYPHTIDVHLPPWPGTVEQLNGRTSGFTLVLDRVANGALYYVEPVAASGDPALLTAASTSAIDADAGLCNLHYPSFDLRIEPFASHPGLLPRSRLRVCELQFAPDHGTFVVRAGAGGALGEIGSLTRGWYVPSVTVCGNYVGGGGALEDDSGVAAAAAAQPLLSGERFLQRLSEERQCVYVDSFVRSTVAAEDSVAVDPAVGPDEELLLLRFDRPAAEPAFLPQTGPPVGIRCLTLVACDLQPTLVFGIQRRHKTIALSRCATDNGGDESGGAQATSA